MSYIKTLRKRGISVSRINIIMLISAFLISAVLFWAMSRTSMLYDETHRITRNLLNWRKDAYELQVASDYLTEQVRCFAVTGERQYLDNYFREAEVTRRRENALQTLQIEYTESAAIRNLRDAMTQSENLMLKEYYAMRLAVEGYGYDLNEYPEVIQRVELSEEDIALKPEEQVYRASDYLFDDEYLLAKLRISNDMNSCLEILENEMNAKQNAVAATLKQQVAAEHVLTVILIGIMLAIVIVISRLVFKPLKKSVEIIRKEEEVPLKGAYEIRFLAKNYNLMYYTTKETENKLNFDANHDKLTGLFNRRGYDFFLNNVDMETSTLMIIDLDKFKSINDNYGHDTGDKAITKAAKIILSSFRSQDYVCRIGGDEFAVIMIRSDSSMKDLITRKVNMINEKLGKPDEDGVPAFSCSVGVAFGRVGLRTSELFKRADTALYNAKENGRNGVAFYSKNLVEKAD
ncbi:MAG: GGDEF domain-containing protein [Eubacterium sp.]|nr:GGDEF domain-containing protein [Eubacterium sp.]